jgi:hypothetical protein
MSADDVKRLRLLEQENTRLKKIIAERDLEIEVMQEIASKKMVGASVRRLQVAYARRRGLSQRMPGDRRCREHQVGPGDRGAIPTDQRTWSPSQPVF